MSLDRATVKKIAKLARLEVADGELDHYTEELSRILSWVEQLGEVDTEGVAPMTGVTGGALPMRADEVTDGGDREAVMANNPAGDPVYFVVPRVVE